jgi:tetratricopeptide (TPR) repeat protein
VESAFLKLFSTIFLPNFLQKNMNFTRFFLLAASIIAVQAASILAQTASTPTKEEPKVQHLLGKCALADFKKAPYNVWYDEGFKAYTPNASVYAALKQTNVAKLRFKIFLGTWCGDSQREFPRLARLLQELGVPEHSIEIIGVNNADSAAKRSPTNEEQGADIFRVPTVQIFEQANKQQANKQQKAGTQEIARVVEYPAETWERDLLRIMRGETYTANYPSYPIIRTWLAEGILADTNMSASGLASRLRHVVASEGELSASAFVLLSRGQVQEAVTLYRINANIFPQSSRCYESLAEGYAKVGKPQQAVRALERALELDAKNAAALNALVKLKVKMDLKTEAKM